ncbi:hypothetical protein AGLY_012291 [Aphis glycines]|uniref:Uncharacterized protein n=1 Tax=Aphis glycines TaxID=307491 RepID=A0A6G0T9U0_APHGL|nr:hypothetical protein AGLY_012291 [Aphis glycines]
MKVKDVLLIVPDFHLCKSFGLYIEVHYYDEKKNNEELLLIITKFTIVVDSHNSKQTWDENKDLRQDQPIYILLSPSATSKFLCCILAFCIVAPCFGHTISEEHPISPDFNNILECFAGNGNSAIIVPNEFVRFPSSSIASKDFNISRAYRRFLAGGTAINESAPNLELNHLSLTNPQSITINNDLQLSAGRKALSCSSLVNVPCIVKMCNIFNFRRYDLPSIPKTVAVSLLGSLLWFKLKYDLSCEESKVADKIISLKVLNSFLSYDPMQFILFILFMLGLVIKIGIKIKTETVFIFNDSLLYSLQDIP